MMDLHSEGNTTLSVRISRRDDDGRLRLLRTYSRLDVLKEIYKPEEDRIVNTSIKCFDTIPVESRPPNKRISCDYRHLDSLVNQDGSVTYRARVTHKGKRHYLGTFKSQERAIEMVAGILGCSVESLKKDKKQTNGI